MPTPEKLLSTLIELYADQMGVNVVYIVNTGEQEDFNNEAR